jgi:EAL domain-containing protein (putative c-di-GMP-specific phosphodiesterase class I)
VAAGTESDEQFRALHHLGCEMGQGFLFGRPASAAQIGSRLEAAVRELATA